MLPWQRSNACHKWTLASATERYNGLGACVTSKNKGLSEEGIERRRVARVLPELELQRPSKLDQGLNQELLLSYAIENPHTRFLLKKKYCSWRKSEIIMESMVT